MSKAKDKPREFWIDAKPKLLSYCRKNTNTGCWEWMRCRQPQGYGVIVFRNKKIMTHRLSYLIYKDEIPEGKFVLHKCDNPPCFNPDHLFIGSKKDNRLDQIKKGRDPAKNATHCKLGHEFTKDNLIPNSGRRQCRSCKAMTKSEWKIKNKEHVRKYKNEWRKRQKELGIKRD